MNDDLFTRLERNRFAPGNDPNEPLGNQAPSMGSIAPAGFVSELMRDGTGVLSNDEDGLIVSDGAAVERVRLGHLGGGDYGLRITNPGGTVIIDGTSNVFKIVASGTLSQTGCNGTVSKCNVNTSVDLDTGLTLTPAFLAHNGASATGIAKSIPSLGLSGSRPMDVVEHLFVTTEVVSSDWTRVTFQWDVSDVDRSGTTSSIRYAVFQEAAF